MRSAGKRLGKVFSGSKADAMVVLNTGIIDSNFLYLTGFTSGVFEDTVLVAEPDRLTLFTSALEYQTAIEQKPKEMEVVKVETRAAFVKGIGSALKGKTVGFNLDFIPYARYGKLKRISGARKVVDSSKELTRARVLKDEEEIENIRKANAITKKAFAGIGEYFKEGVTERELAARFDYIMGENGAGGRAFPTIVAFGKNAASPHHMPDGTRMKPNSFVLIDAGARHNNYCADMTRTAIFKPDRKSQRYPMMEEMAAVVEGAQEAAFDIARAGVDGSEVHMAAERVIETAHNGKYRGRFIHSLGHSIGIDVHDGGAGLSGNLHMKLEEGMVLSNEPGIYMEGFGGVRKEDDMVIRKGRAQWL